jgi:hypothetical protein
MAHELARATMAVSGITAAEPWEAWLVPTPLPVPGETRDSLREVIDRLVTHLCTSMRLAPEFFLQFNQLHNENGSSKLSTNGRKWMPRLGLGVWPDRDPPSLWTPEEFQNLSPGEMIRPLMHQVFQSMAPIPGRHDCRNAFFGIGSGLTVLVKEGDTGFVQRTTSILRPRITEPSFQAFEFYIPLLEARSLAATDAATTDEWLPGVQCYVRESCEDGGILIVSRVPLEKTLQDNGLKPPEVRSNA